MENAVDLLNERLSQFFDTNNSDYQIFVAGKNHDYTLPLATGKPTDLDLGLMACYLEYNRLFYQSVLDQMDIQKAEGEGLDYLGNYIYGIWRENGETDAAYRTKIFVKIFGKKETKVSIQLAITPYNGSGSPLYPFILEGESLNDLGMFADYSYTDIFQRFYSPPADVFPAITNPYGTSGTPRFYFKVFMLDVLPANYQKVFDEINARVVAGVHFQVVFLSQSIYG